MATSLLPKKLKTGFEQAVRAVMDQVPLEEPEMLAQMLPLAVREQYASIFEDTILSIQDMLDDYHWEIGFLFFYFDVAGLLQLKEYNSFNEYITENRKQLRISPSWAYKLRAVYEFFVWKLGIVPGHQDYDLLMSVRNFDKLATIIEVSDQENYRPWLDLAANPDYDKEYVMMEVYFAKRRMREGGATMMEDVKPSYAIPPIRVKTSKSPEGNDLHASDLPDFIRGEIPPNEKVEVIVRIRKS